MAEQQQKVRDAMTDDTPTISPDASVADAARMMRDTDVAILTVVDESEQLIGVITDWDITIVVAAEADASSTTVGQAMSEQPISVEQDQSLDEALQRMVDQGVHRAPVTDEGGHVSGTLSQDDATTQGERRSDGESE
jgi:CBS domain-containing protein